MTMVRAGRGAEGDIGLFAERFIRGRLVGFTKDMAICLTVVRRPESTGGTTCAYFPALAACCSMLEYLTALFVGRLSGVGAQDVTHYAARYMPQPQYDREVIRVLFDAFRNTVNHRGIATGVWLDHHAAKAGRRLTWKIHESDEGPPMQVLEEQGNITKDSPWPCPYTHRVHIRLGRLWRDIEESATPFVADIAKSAALQDNFLRCMRRLYPPACGWQAQLLDRFDRVVFVHVER